MKVAPSGPPIELSRPKQRPQNRSFPRKPFACPITFEFIPTLEATLIASAETPFGIYKKYNSGFLQNGMNALKSE